MATIVEFRKGRNEADVVRPRPTAFASPSHPINDPVTSSAEIILMPLTWLKQLGRVRKPLRRRFAAHEIVPA
jgi:hypothetical protein